MGRKKLVAKSAAKKESSHGKNSFQKPEKNSFQKRKKLVVEKKESSIKRRAVVFCKEKGHGGFWMQTALCEILCLEEIPGHEMCYGCTFWDKESLVLQLGKRKKLVGV